ncbi:MAG TPA: TlyA family RNA methyltransferase [Candidatus Binataceae bacterium]|jgi:23S rRNA (cytidine1920-2'-O)/16S rRNA (cytidine1409-2'-O)-methyltransferase|nr:TlyA family RNA methyltransferase [Candidatus Binataceae bacterium]
MRTRLDLEMTRRGLAESREGAQRLIMTGRVRVNSRPAAKPDLKVDADTEIALIGGGPEYASRGGYKLAAAIDHFQVEVNGRRTLDVGASTGGFTDVLLQRGAASVIALDVGYGQLAEKLRRDSRVTVIDRTNIRRVAPADLPYAPDLVVVDTSFISLRLVLPPVIEIATPTADIVALVKPQFEVGKGKVGKGGVVRDAILRASALEGILSFAREIGLEAVGSIESPIHGAAGNIEYLALLRKRGS